MFVQRFGNSGAVTACTVWQTVKLGAQGLSAADFRTALTLYRCRMAGSVVAQVVEEMLNCIIPAPEETEIDLVKLSVAELGFRAGAEFGQIREKASEMGLILCPAEVGPQLRLQYLRQPKGEVIYIAMEPVLVLGSPRLFTVAQAFDWLWLGCAAGDPRSHYGARAQFVFVRPRA